MQTIENEMPLQENAPIWNMPTNLVLKCVTCCRWENRTSDLYANKDACQYLITIWNISTFFQGLGYNPAMLKHSCTCSESEQHIETPLRLRYVWMRLLELDIPKHCRVSQSIFYEWIIDVVQIAMVPKLHVCTRYIFSAITVMRSLHVVSKHFHLELLGFLCPYPAKN